MENWHAQTAKSKQTQPATLHARVLDNLLCQLAGRQQDEGQRAVWKCAAAMPLGGQQLQAGMILWKAPFRGCGVPQYHLWVTLRVGQAKAACMRGRTYVPRRQVACRPGFSRCLAPRWPPHRALPTAPASTWGCTQRTERGWERHNTTAWVLPVMPFPPTWSVSAWGR